MTAINARYIVGIKLRRRNKPRFFTFTNKRLRNQFVRHMHGMVAEVIYSPEKIPEASIADLRCTLITGEPILLFKSPV